MLSDIGFKPNITALELTELAAVLEEVSKPENITAGTTVDKRVFRLNAHLSGVVTTGSFRNTYQIENVRSGDVVIFTNSVTGTGDVKITGITKDELKENSAYVVGSFKVVSGGYELYLEQTFTIAGAKGPIGNKGSVGAKGPSGYDGLKGRLGNTGTPGEVGPVGDKGMGGVKGPLGYKGDTGPKGDRGESGVTGSVGPRGDKGDKGPDGYDGEPGTIGDTGEVGDSGDRGPIGDSGDSGSKGAIGPKGDRGATGNTGAKGDTGNKGFTGAKGGDGNRGYEGDNGNAGARGSRGPTGDKGAVTIDVTQINASAFKTSEMSVGYNALTKFYNTDAVLGIYKTGLLESLVESVLHPIVNEYRVTKHILPGAMNVIDLQSLKEDTSYKYTSNYEGRGESGYFSPKFTHPSIDKMAERYSLKLTSFVLVNTDSAIESRDLSYAVYTASKPYDLPRMSTYNSNFMRALCLDYDGRSDILPVATYNRYGEPTLYRHVTYNRSSSNIENITGAKDSKNYDGNTDEGNIYNICPERTFSDMSREVWVLSRDKTYCICNHYNDRYTMAYKKSYFDLEYRTDKSDGDNFLDEGGLDSDGRISKVVVIEDYLITSIYFKKKLWLVVFKKVRTDKYVEVYSHPGRVMDDDSLTDAYQSYTAFAPDKERPLSLYFAYSYDGYAKLRRLDLKEWTTYDYPSLRLGDYKTEQIVDLHANIHGEVAMFCRNSDTGIKVKVNETGDPYVKTPLRQYHDGIGPSLIPIIRDDARVANTYYAELYMSKTRESNTRAFSYKTYNGDTAVTSNSGNRSIDISGEKERRWSLVCSSIFYSYIEAYLRTDSTEKIYRAFITDNGTNRDDSDILY